MDMLLSPEDRAQIAQDTHDVMRAVGRPITVQVVTTASCSVCGGVDQTTGFPKNPLCPTCDGTGESHTEQPVQIQAAVRWVKTDDLKYTEPGRVDLGSCTVEVEPQWRPYFKEGMELMVDGQRVTVVNIAASGIGQVNRIIVECQKVVEQ